VKQIDGEIGSYQNISVHDAKQLIDNTQNIVLLDVRNQSEYDLGHLYDAQLIPLYSLENRTLPMELEPPPVDDAFMFGVYQAMLNSFHLSAHVNDPIIVYCKAGYRSASACELLVEQGYTQVYNVVGGITEWMKADYPTFTPRHHVDVAVVDGETIIDIEPWLLYTADCIPCQDLLENEPTATTPVNITDTIIQQSGNSTLTHSALEIDGTILELLTENTVVWQQNETSLDFNRTMSLSSRISSTPEGKTLQAFELYVQVQHNDYLITISTFLQVLDDLTYNQSTTYMEYLPAGAKPFTTVEVVEFTTAVSLSGLFKSLAETVDALGYGYEVSEDDSLQVFAERYYTLADEVQLLSHTVETVLSSYDKLILFNMAVIEDGWGDVCDILCPLAILVGCVAACYFSGGALCTFCILFDYELGNWLYASLCSYNYC
jgi:rhodanese-related sulfurtransferase